MARKPWFEYVIYTHTKIPSNTTHHTPGDTYIMADLLHVPSMGVAEFAVLNYTSKKSYNARGIAMQMESVVPAIGLSLFFNRSLIVSD